MHINQIFKIKEKQKMFKTWKHSLIRNSLYYSLIIKSQLLALQKIVCYVERTPSCL